MRSKLNAIFHHSLLNRITAMILTAAMVLGGMYFGPSGSDAAEELSYYATGDMTISAETILIASDGNEHTMEEISFLQIEPDATVMFSSGESGKPVGNDGLVVDMNVTDGTLVIQEGAQLTCQDLRFCGDVTNEGTIEAENIINGDEEPGDLTNNGTIRVTNYGSNNSETRFRNYGNLYIPSLSASSMTGIFYNEGYVETDSVYFAGLEDITTSVVQSRDTSIYSVKDSISLTGYNSELLGTFKTQKDTMINSDGGSFWLQVGSWDSTMIIGAVDNKTAGTLAKPAPRFTTTMTDQIFGIPYDALDYVTCTSTATVTASYWRPDTGSISDDYVLIGTEPPTMPGSYRVVYHVDENDDFSEGDFDTDYHVNFLEDDPGLCTISGTKADEQYNGVDVYAGPVTVTAPEGYKILPPGSESLDDFAETCVISEDGYYDGLTVMYQRKSDGGITEMKDAYTSPFYVNSNAPVLTGIWDQDDNELTINGENTYDASSVIIQFEDPVNITAFTVDGESVLESDYTGSTIYSTVLTLDTPGNGTFAVAVTNHSGLTRNVTITLNNVLLPVPEDPYTVSGVEGDGGFYTSDVVLLPAEGFTISSTAEGVYGDELDYDESITEIWLKQKETGRFTEAVTVEKVLIDKEAPVFKASFGSLDPAVTTLTDGMDLNFKTMNLSVSDPENNLASVSVNGEEVTGVEAEGYSTTITASKTSETVSLTAKDKAGNTVTVSLLCQDKRQDADVTFTIADVEYGEEIVPSLVTDHDGKEGVIYKYKIGEDFGNTLPTEIGEYEAEALISETDTYNEVIAVTTFSITKMTPVLSVSVPDTVYGEEYAPTVETDSDGAVTYGYKSADDVEGAYTETRPTIPGTYSVRASLAEGTMHKSAVAYHEFTIDKLEVTAFVTVENIVMGGTISPVVTTVSDGKGNAEFKYKAKNSSAYLDDVPEAVGEYDIQATVPETDIYKKIVCYGSFSILRKTVEASVTVADIIFGGTIVPVVETESNGKSSAEFKYRKKGETKYEPEVPTEAGEYEIQATIPETESYEMIVCEGSFKILRKTPYAYVTVPDIELEEKPAVNLDTDSDGWERATYEYKLQEEDEGKYTVNEPDSPGTYDIRVTVPMTNNYESITCTGSFKVLKKTDHDISLEADNVEYSEPLEIHFHSYSDGTPTIQYKKKSDPDTEYSGTEPTAVGDYVVRVILPETERYYGDTLTAEFSIVRYSGAEVEVTVPDFEYGGTTAPVIETVSDGKSSAKFKYKKKTDTTYSDEIPTAVGEYDVWAIVPETANYEATEGFGSFRITKKIVTATVTVADIFFGETVVPVVDTVSDGKTTAEFKYKKKTDTTYSGEVPSQAGEYDVWAIVPETVNYEATEAFGSFSILKKPASATVSVGRILVGTEYMPRLETDSKGKVIFEYKKITEKDSAYTENRPVSAGRYMVRATVAETETFRRAVAVSEFEIVYLGQPEEEFTPKGEEGENGYFTSDVILYAPAGYLISAQENGPFSQSIPYTEGMKAYYLQRVTDRALTDVITIDKEIMIDKDQPEADPMLDETGKDVSLSESVYANCVTFRIKDDNLASVTVNGNPVTIVDHTAEIILDPARDSVEFTVVATDIAGNRYTRTITISAVWLMNGEVPEGEPLPLKPGKGYSMPKGTWNVNDGKMDYVGGRTFYVRKADSYTFTHK